MIQICNVIKCISNKIMHIHGLHPERFLNNAQKKIAEDKCRYIMRSWGQNESGGGRGNRKKVKRALKFEKKMKNRAKNPYTERRLGKRMKGCTGFTKILSHIRIFCGRISLIR